MNHSKMKKQIRQMKQEEAHVRAMIPKNNDAWIFWIQIVALSHIMKNS
jgi:hypothetical protein